MRWAEAPPPASDPAASTSLSNVRRGDGQITLGIPFAKLIEMIATGDLGADDEVALMGADFRFIRDVHELGRHLLPSTTATTSRLFEPGIPDYQVLIRDTPMLEESARISAASSAPYAPASRNTSEP